MDACGAERRAVLQRQPGPLGLHLQATPGHALVGRGALHGGRHPVLVRGCCRLSGAVCRSAGLAGERGASGARREAGRLHGPFQSGAAGLRVSAAPGAAGGHRRGEFSPALSVQVPCPLQLRRLGRADAGGGGGDVAGAFPFEGRGGRQSRAAFALAESRAADAERLGSHGGAGRRRRGGGGGPQSVLLEDRPGRAAAAVPGARGHAGHGGGRHRSGAVAAGRDLHAKLACAGRAGVAVGAGGGGSPGVHGAGAVSDGGGGGGGLPQPDAR
ncbi:MAG: hypothetical protein BWZ02_03353 [Lentisphaerae bacterium ADurb.BinA184]|nr:MAG: hypothetical protein BWZ02_03353 [Lentisphaerae bacterium ADurb.BinA184]